MYDTIEAQGIVLDTSLIKEYDKRLVILTEKLGRITVFANGARRKNSQLTAVSQKFVMANFKLRPSSQNTYTLISAEIMNTFMDLSYDIEKMAYASYISEVAGFFTNDGMPAVDELNLIYVTYKTILQDAIPLKLIKSTFECKLLDIEGLFSKDELIRISKPKTISQDASFVIDYILSRDISETYSFKVADRVINEVEELITKYLKTQCDRNFKSLDILESLL
ncbi:MAG: DNA repair protein RecO [Eubacterium sp.]|nr:DNA repair protein RecO [Eubacterium sp.]